MDNSSDSRKTGEKKSPPLGNQILLYLLAVGIGTWIVFTLYNARTSLQMPYGKLEELIQQHSGSPGRTVGYVEIVGGTPQQPEVRRYRDPKDVIVGDRDITGKVHQTVVDPVSRKELTEHEQTQDVKFQVRKSPEMAEAVLALFKNYDFKNFAFDDGPGFWKTWGPMLVITGLFVLVFFLMMRRLGGAGSPMAFGRSRGKLYAQEDLGVTFDDVAGINEAVDELKEVVEFLRSPEKYQRLGGRIPKGVLLVGPPGTGKTLLAKSVAGEASVPFFSLSGSDFVEMFVGVGAARVRDMFQQAEAKAPCIIFIDELDALGKTRGTSVVGGHDEREQTLNALLVEMDGFDSNSGVIVLAATNRPETLDPALLRPGRFDRHVLVDRPDVRGREDILKVHVKNVKLSDGVEIKKVAAITPGFCGADLANLVNEAALLAARADKNAVGMVEFNEGVERVTAGLEKKQRIIQEDEKQRIAYHECGHALVADSLPNTDPVHKISIIPRGLAALGYTMQRPEQDRYLVTKSELESRIQVLLAGTVAEELVFEDISTGAQNDLERATAIARSMVMEYGMSRLGRVNYQESGRSAFIPTSDTPGGAMHSERTAHEIDQEVKRIIDEGLERVRYILRERRDTLIALSVRLLEQEVMDADELREIVDETSSEPKIVPGTESVASGTDGPRKRVEETDESDRAEGTGSTQIVLAMRLITYNIHKGIGGRDRRYRLQRIADVIERENPDLICLQEVNRHVRRTRFHDQPAELAKRFCAEAKLFQLNVHLKHGGYGNLVLTRWPVVEKHHLSLRLGDKKPRGAQLAIVDTPEGKLHLVNWHLGLAEKERHWQVRRLLTHHLFRRGSELPTVIAGDTNDWRNTLADGPFSTHGFRQVTVPLSRYRTFPAYLPVGSLDKIYYRGEIDIRHVRAVRTALSRKASDHLPVVVDLHLARK